MTPMVAAPARALTSRIGSTPIIPAGSVRGYGPIFNAGLLHHDGRFHLFARGVRDGYACNLGPGPRFLDYISDILVFTSVDGWDYEFEYVLARAGDFGVACYEDPRVQVVDHAGDAVVVMTYTNLPPFGSGLPWRIGAHRLRFDNHRFALDPASGCLLGPAGVENKDAVVFNLRDGRVALIHRIYPNMQLAIFEDLDHLWHADEAYWSQHLGEIDQHTIIRPTPGSFGVGAGAPPVLVDDELLLFFHEREGSGHYTARLAVLDAHTGRVKRSLDEALMRPELHWERYGDVDNVVFVQGAHRLDEDTVYLIYGAADRCVGAATVSVSHLAAALEVDDVARALSPFTSTMVET